MKAARTDEELLKAFLDGRTDGLAGLAARHERALLGLASGLLGGRRELACDAVQEAWVRVIRFAGQFNGRSSVKTWLYRIVVNQCRTLAAAQPAPASPLDALPVPSAASDPEAPMQQVEASADLRRALDALSAEQRGVIALCYHTDLTHEDAAEVLEIPLGTLKSRLHAALGELRARLAKEARP